MIWPSVNRAWRPRARTRPATAVEVAILEIVRGAFARNQELSTTEVADAAKRTAGHVSRILHRLEASGLVKHRKALDRKRPNVVWCLWRPA